MADITYPVAGGAMRGYVAEPSTPGPWPGVVVVHELFGLTDDIRRQADRFAAEGYVAFAPDLYDWGATARCLIATLRTLATGRGRALDDIQAARAFLAGRDDCTGRVGVIGFCLGGGLAILTAHEGFDAAAPNYGQLPKDLERRVQSSCPVVASYGARDRMLKGAASRLDAALTSAGVPHDVKEYPTAKHGFLFEHTGRTAITSPLMVEFDQAAAEDAWQRIFAFFGEHVKGA